MSIFGVQRDTSMWRLQGMKGMLTIYRNFRLFCCLAIHRCIFLPCETVKKANINCNIAVRAITSIQDISRLTFKILYRVLGTCIRRKKCKKKYHTSHRRHHAQMTCYLAILQAFFCHFLTLTLCVHAHLLINCCLRCTII